MITHGMKGSVPVSEYDHFLTVTQGEDELKKAADFSASDDAYVILLDPAGKITWHTHGDVSDATLKQLAEQVNAVTRK
jgi:predicted transcriptional regulator